MDNYNYLNEEDFLKAHLLLMKYFEDDNGTYRNHGEEVKKDDEIIFMAPDSILVPTFMNNLFTFINENNNSMHLVILSAIFHYYLVYIHPFTDENEPLGQQKTYLQKYLQNKGFTDFGKSFFLNKFSILFNVLI